MEPVAATNSDFDLHEFDLESAELLDCHIDVLKKTVVLRLRCPVNWWRLRVRIVNLFRLFKLERLVRFRPIEYDVEIRLEGFRALQGSMLDSCDRVKPGLFSGGALVLSGFMFVGGSIENKGKFLIECDDECLSGEFSFARQRRIGRNHLNHDGIWCEKAYTYKLGSCRTSL